MKLKPVILFAAATYTKALLSISTIIIVARLNADSITPVIFGSSLAILFSLYVNKGANLIGLASIDDSNSLDELNQRVKFLVSIQIKRLLITFLVGSPIVTIYQNTNAMTMILANLAFISTISGSLVTNWYYTKTLNMRLLVRNEILYRIFIYLACCFAALISGQGALIFIGFFLGNVLCVLRIQDSSKLRNEMEHEKKTAIQRRIRGGDLLNTLIALMGGTVVVLAFLLGNKDATSLGLVEKIARNLMLISAPISQMMQRGNLRSNSRNIAIKKNVFITLAYSIPLSMLFYMLSRSLIKFLFNFDVPKYLVTIYAILVLILGLSRNLGVDLMLTLGFKKEVTVAITCGLCLYALTLFLIYAFTTLSFAWAYLLGELTILFMLVVFTVKTLPKLRQH